MKLASIEQINTVEKHPNADRLDIATVVGKAWRCIVGRDSFKSGDKCVFICIDSEVPASLWPMATEREFERVKTIRLRGQFSQGLILSVPKDLKDEPIGADIGFMLGVRKYEKPEPSMSGDLFPVHLISKTDEMNLLSYPQLLDEMRMMLAKITIKADGSSGTFFYDDRFHVCSRKLDLFEGARGFWGEIAEKYDLERKMSNMENIAVQGEVVGPSIQGNPMGLTERDFLVFGVKDLAQDEWVHGQLEKDIIDFLGMKSVEVVSSSCRIDENTTINQMQEIANSVKYPNGEPAEGIVVRPLYPAWSEFIGRQLSFKVINQNYGE